MLYISRYTLRWLRLNDGTYLLRTLRLWTYSNIVKYTASLSAAHASQSVFEIYWYDTGII